IGVTTVVGVLGSLLSMSEGAQIFTGKDARPEEMVVLSRGAPVSLQSVLPREAVVTVQDAPGVKRAPDRSPYAVAPGSVNVNAVRKDGRRGRVIVVGYTSGVKLVQDYVNIIEGRYYKPALREVIVPDPIRKMYKGMNLGDKITMRGGEWEIVGIV